MKNNPLNIVSVDNTPPQPSRRHPSRRESAQAKYDRLWLQNPNQFNPLRNCMENERIHRSLAFIKSALNIDGKAVIDLGCGQGAFSRLLRDSGATVVAVDIAANALKALQEGGDLTNITPQRDFVPKTLLEDSSFDLVVALDLIAYLDPNEFRLFFAEVARLVKANGNVVCSTPIDILSDNALQRFAALAATELHIEKWSFSHHALYIRIKDFFLAPSRFVRAFNDKSYREEAIAQRFSINRIWFTLNSTAVAYPFWLVLKYVFTSVVRLLDNNRSLMLLLEKISRSCLYNQGISHAILLATRKPLVIPTADSQQPIEPKHKKQVWE